MQQCAVSDQKDAYIQRIGACETFIDNGQRVAHQTRIK